MSWPNLLAGIDVDAIAVGEHGISQISSGGDNTGDIELPWSNTSVD